MNPPPSDEAFEAAKRGSVAQVLFKTARLLNELALQRLRDAANQPALRPAHTSLLPHLDFKGQRLTTLAGTLGVSKQAVGQLVNDLEAMGMVERVPDPSDGRAKLVRYSARGKESLMHGLGVLRGLEGELAGELGAERLARLHADLLTLLELLESGQVSALLPVEDRGAPGEP